MWQTVIVPTMARRSFDEAQNATFIIRRLFLIDMDLEHGSGVAGRRPTIRGIPKVDALQIVQPSNETGPPANQQETGYARNSPVSSDSQAEIGPGSLS